MMEEFFADQLEVKVSDSPEHPVVSISFGLRMDGGYAHRVLLHETSAKQLALLLHKLVKVREEVLGHTINLTEEFYKRAGIAPEDF